MKPKPDNWPVQYFTDEYLERCKTMTPLQILEFLEDFRTLMTYRLNATNKNIVPKKTK